jgi:hypothetical protein
VPTITENDKPMLNPQAAAVLKGFITRDDPFGPGNSEDIFSRHGMDDQPDDEVFTSLFDIENKIHANLRTRPTLIVGRRGAGKTAFLRYLLRTHKKEEHLVFELKSWSVVKSLVLAVKSQCQKSGSFVTVEEAAEIWEFVLNLGLFTRIKQHGVLLAAHTPKIDDLLANLNILAEENIEQVLKKAANAWDNNTATEHQFSEALAEAQALLTRHNTCAVFLMDSLEDYNLNEDHVSVAMGGFLKCIGMLNRGGSRFWVHCCLPAELYHVFKRFSQNPQKVFPSALRMHWWSTELVEIAGHRFSLYLELHEEEFYIENLVEERLHAPDGKRSLLANAMPEDFRNRYDILEDPLVYILRHTQLLPRHFLTALNAIWSENRRLEGSDTFMSSRAIIEGVKRASSSTAEGIFLGYNYLYPEAKELCTAVLPELPLAFFDEILRLAYRKATGDTGPNKYTDFKRMMIEIGVIGRVVESDNFNIYGKFEYQTPGELKIGPSDQLCIHPLFSTLFRRRDSGREKGNKVVCPFGVNTEQSVDDRILFSF